MAKNMTYTDKLYSIGKQGAIETTTSTDGSVSHDGRVATWHGYVVVYSWTWHKDNKGSRLEIIHNGEIYVRYFDEYFRPQKLVQLANQFAADTNGANQ